MSKLLVGEVVSDINDKTIVVRYFRICKDKKYRKTLRISSKLHVHDELNKYKIGDHVTIKSSVPISLKKKWTVVYPETGKMLSPTNVPNKEVDSDN